MITFTKSRFVTANLTKPHDPATFWIDTKEPPARYVSGGFTRNVVTKAKPQKAGGIIKVPYCDMPEDMDMSVKDIINTPGVGDFDPSMLSHIFASMISAQPNGEPGDLLTNGNANLAVCGGALVGVDWDDVVRCWSVYDWRPVGVVRAGRRVLSADLL